MGGAPTAVRPASNSTIELDFYCNGIRLRPRLKLPPTRANLRYAENLLGQIRIEIEKGVFDYGKHFPASRRSRRLAQSTATVGTVQHELSAWLKRKEPAISHSTYIEYERTIRKQLNPAFGSKLVGDLTASDFRTWAAQRPTATSKWINNLLSPLRQLLEELFADRRIPENALHGLRFRRVRHSHSDAPDAEYEDDDEIDPFRPDEVRAIMEHARVPQFRNLCAFAFFAGLRPSELLALRWSDVDLEKRAVRVRRAFVRGRLKPTKTSSGRRTVELLPMALEALRAQRQHTQLVGDTVFLNHRTGRPYASGKAIRERDWKTTLRIAGVPYRAPKQMRHTFASMMLSAGENVMWVARQMGHKDWTVTARRYARFIPGLDPTAGQKAIAAWEVANADQKADHANTK